MKAVVIANYLKDLGPLKSAVSYSTLATACQLALDGRGPPDFRDQVIATIAWQNAQIQLVDRLLEHLAGQGLITVVEEEGADQALADHQEYIVPPVVDRLMEDEKLVCLMNPPTTGHVGVHFDDALNWLLGILAYNRLIHPDSFDLERVAKEVFTFLASFVCVRTSYQRILKWRFE